MPSKLKALFRLKESRSQSSLATASHQPFSETTAPQQELFAQPSQIVNSQVSTAKHEPAPSAPIGEGQNYGVKVLHDGGLEPSIDIVFVHGLTGNAYNTWLHKGTMVHWPSELLRQDISDARILSFGYDADIVNLLNPASKSRLSNHAENMVGDLVRMRERTNTESRKILFVAHSLGGLITEHALSHSRAAVEEHLHQIESCTAGIVFLGVPHCGTDLASWADFGRRMASVLRPTNKDILKILEPGSEMLRVVQKDFHKILRLRKNEGSEISITCFYEELDVIGVGEIVPLYSAEIKGYSCYGIHANHMDMTKFSNREDQGYNAILGELQRWKKSAYKAFGKESESDSAKPTYWMIPRSCSRLYTGRRELGERLAQVFSHGHLITLMQRTFVIVGIGGTGKSEVCLKFAEDQRNEYWGIFWLDASSVVTATRGYMNIGQCCGVAEPSVENVKSWLAFNKLPWLLIIDNADNPDIDYSEYMPPGRMGDILLTTRLKECVTYETVGSTTLGVLEFDLARELLLRATHILRSRWEEIKKAATTVVEVLGSHTLAIVQAGAYIRHRLCTLEEYPIIFQQRKEQLLKFYSKQNVSTYDNVYTTFEISAKYLQSSKNPEDLEALDFLHTLAFMHYGEIEEELFQRASEYALKLRNAGTSDDERALSLSVRHVARLPEYAQQKWSSLQCRSRWRKLCATLESLSIITMNDDSNSIIISMHPLVHAWAKERQDHQTRCRMWQSAATILALSCEGHIHYSHTFISLHPQVRACVSHEIEDYTWDMSELVAAQILFRFAIVLDRMQDESSLASLVQCIRLRLRDAADQEIVLHCKYFTGRAFLRQGRFEEAVEVFKDVFDAMAEDHPSRLYAQSTLAFAYQRNGQIDKAVKLLEPVVKIRNENLVEDHPDRIDAQHALATAYQANEQIDEAIKLLEHVVEIGKKKLVEDHPYHLMRQQHLASAYLKIGQNDKAIKLLEYVVEIAKKKFPKDHSSRLDSQHALAIAYQANEQIDEAIKLLEHVVEIGKKKWVEGHPSRLASQHALALAYEERAS